MELSEVNLDEELIEKKKNLVVDPSNKPEVNNGTTATRPSGTPTVPPDVEDIDRGMGPNFKVIQQERWSLSILESVKSVIPNCLLSFFCPCIPLAQMYHRMGIANFIVVLGMLLPLYFLIGALLFVSSASKHSRLKALNPEYVTCYIVWIIIASFILYLRYNVRRKFNIPGNVAIDGFASVCCSCCIIAQMSAHLNIYTTGRCLCDRPIRLQDKFNVV